MELLKHPTKIRTYVGKMIDPYNPDPEMITLVDIAHSLSNICRWNGHSMRFYSVAQHSLFVSGMMDRPEDKLAALLHDASEAYLTDLPRPVKYRMDKYFDVEFNLMMVISRKFGFQYPLSVVVQDADDYALQFEYDNIVTNDRIKTLTPHDAKHEFLRQLDMLTNPVITEGI